MAQTPANMPTIPAIRVWHHEDIIGSQKKIQALFATTRDTVNKPNWQLDSFNHHITAIRINIELNNNLNNNDKFKWLRSTNEILTSFIYAFNVHLIQLSELTPLVKAFDKAMGLAIANQSVYTIFEQNSLAVGSILIDNYGLVTNKGIAMAKDLLVWKYCQLYPEKILATLSNNPSNIFADTLLVQAAFLDPEKLYNYAAAPNALGKKIQSVNHRLVKLIGQFSITKTGRMYMPFLDNLYHNTITVNEITPLLTTENAENYYQLLVRTRIDYIARMQHADTPILVKVLTDKLKDKAVELYINEINALHEEKNPKIRFLSLEKLSAQDLYYLAVMGEAEMYTSSFVSGIYPRIFQRMKKPDANDLLESVHNDYVKKFIKISAAYNTLDDFLQKMDSSIAFTRMKQFVDGLEKTKSLEEAVDVADAFTSIYQPKFRKLILDQVHVNLLAAQQKKQIRSKVIYQLLETIFASMDSTNHIDIAAELGIAPVYFMPNKLLQNAQGKIIIQQFFYGDKDGMTIFNAFVTSFTPAKWKIIQHKDWIEIASKKGVPISIYANRPLNQEQDLDEQAQDVLIDYLKSQQLTPSVVIHRGHSYHLSSTIEKLASSAKLVILGGCGGYQNLNQVLAICPGAHIISTKQVGTGIINKGLINEISETLRLGQNLNWPSLWTKMDNQFKAGLKESFNDYVPPHKNLGAIFIMAYQKKINQQ
ncbi:MAG: hypothetical protein WCL56_04750 [Sediminibacterium sp.]